MTSVPRRLTAETYAAGVLASDRVLLSRAITLVESRHPADAELAGEVLARVLPHTGRSVRVGITGVPGVGKSTFIEALGRHLTEELGQKLAVLTIDPSSGRSGGSILGDKTRMETLGRQPLAYIRPSPAGRTLGGIARRTRETLLLCEAAGYEIIFVETVGVGQSETAVRGMTDFFLLLLLAGAGDELQGVKRGIMEMADAIAITKADGGNETKARAAAAACRNALHLFPPADSGWTPSVLTLSALASTGIAEVWQTVEAYRQQTQQNGFWETQRRQQQRQWVHEAIENALREGFYQHPTVQTVLPELLLSVERGETPPVQAAEKLLQLYRQSGKE